MSAKSTPYRFRPRFVGVAFVSISIGTILIVSSLTITPDRMSATFSFFVGLIGLFLAFSYLKSPVWRLAVDIQEDDLVVWNGLEERMRLPWQDIEKVVMGPEGQTCYVDGGSAERSLLVPGPGAGASYDIRHKKKLIEAILAHVSDDIVESSEEIAKTAE